MKAVGVYKFVHVLSNLEAKLKQPVKSAVKESSAVADDETGLKKRAIMYDT